MSKKLVLAIVGSPNLETVAPISDFFHGTKFSHIIGHNCLYGEQLAKKSCIPYEDVPFDDIPRTCTHIFAFVRKRDTEAIDILKKSAELGRTFSVLHVADDQNEPTFKIPAVFVLLFVVFLAVVIQFSLQKFAHTCFWR